MTANAVTLPNLTLPVCGGGATTWTRRFHEQLNDVCTHFTLPASPPMTYRGWNVQSSQLRVVPGTNPEPTELVQPYWKLSIDLFCTTYGYRTLFAGRKPTGPTAAGTYNRDDTLATYPVWPHSRATVLMVQQG